MDLEIRGVGKWEAFLLQLTIVNAAPAAMQQA